MNFHPILPSVRIAQLFYAAALLAFGIQHFIFGTFVAGRPMPWPAGMEGEIIAAYISGMVLITGTVSILLNQKTTEVLLTIAAMILLWAGFRNAFHVITTFDTGGNLTNMGKAFTLGLGAILIAQSLEPEKYRILKLAVLCQYFTGLFLLASGIQHFLYADFVKFLIPAWIPAPIFITYFSGIALALSGLLLVTNIQVKLVAALGGWMILLWVIVLHLPRTIEFNNQNEWTAIFEALAVSGILFLISRTANKNKD